MHDHVDNFQSSVTDVVYNTIITHRLTILMGVREVTPLLRTHGFWLMELQMILAPYTLQRMKHAMQKISVVTVSLVVAALL